MAKALLLLAGLLIYASSYAEPIAKATAGQVTITLYTDECQLKEVTNLKHRATWTEGGVTSEGCWDMEPTLQAVVAYWVVDKTVSAIPAQVFERVTGA